MPLYEYTCLACGKPFELLRPVSERGEPSECPHCGEKRRHPLGVSLFATSGSSDSASSPSSCSPSGFG
ncbi:MAG: zinc ribbon domain-containing protein [Deltaproteobacteria bacterium]|nr:zinc ribbon domain-containing protein [Deltaproteobacteria bacterium]